MAEAVVDASVAKAHLASVVAAVTNPIERMLRESFVLVHCSVTQLQVKTAEATDTH